MYVHCIHTLLLHIIIYSAEPVEEGMTGGTVAIDTMSLMLTTLHSTYFPSSPPFSPSIPSLPSPLLPFPPLLSPHSPPLSFPFLPFYPLTPLPSPPLSFPSIPSLSCPLPLSHSSPLPTETVSCTGLIFGRKQYLKVT